MNEIENWIIVKISFILPRDGKGRFEAWTSDIKKKAQVNVKAVTTLQCGLFQEQLSKVRPFQSTKEL